MVKGRNRKVRRGMSYEKQIMKDTKDSTFIELKRLAQEEEKWRDAVH